MVTCYYINSISCGAFSENHVYALVRHLGYQNMLVIILWLAPLIKVLPIYPHCTESGRVGLLSIDVEAFEMRIPSSIA